ncbi:MAG: hypothetical protein ACLTLQ_13660 [[Clostridium] scindens]
MAEEQKESMGFFKRLVSGLERPGIISYQASTAFSAAFPILTMIFMRNWKKC